MAFVENNFISSVPVILILAREFMVTGLRLAAAGKGNVIAANMWGKIKTTLQGASMGGIFVSVLVQSLLSDNTVMKYSEIENISLIPNILIWVCALYTIISVIPYYKASKRYIKD